ncbi:MAG TPA: MEDS domain-containing protein [Fimbriimonadaceae bacterium]|nr:MEDS domain-containing protein [Fimbriimonadaceae bacterium]
MPTTLDAPVRLAGRTLDKTRHICAFFNSKEEQNRILMPFFKEGYDRGEMLFHIVDPGHKEAHLCACGDCGIDVDTAQQSGQLEVKVWEDAYLKDGYFDGDRMIRTLEAVLNGSRGKYPLVRLMGNMEWALEALPGVNDIVEYEAKLNYVLPKYPDPVVCVYDLNKHSGSVIMDILRTHPLVIVGGVLQENPLYIPPDEFLLELRSRPDRTLSAALGKGTLH